MIVRAANLGLPGLSHFLAALARYAANLNAVVVRSLEPNRKTHPRPSVIELLIRLISANVAGAIRDSPRRAVNIHRRTVSTVTAIAAVATVDPWRMMMMVMGTMMVMVVVAVSAGRAHKQTTKGQRPDSNKGQKNALHTVAPVVQKMFCANLQKASMPVPR
jgi:hypothetical protein